MDTVPFPGNTMLLVTSLLLMMLIQPALGDIVSLLQNGQSGCLTMEIGQVLRRSVSTKPVILDISLKLDMKKHYEAIFTIDEQHPEWIKHERNYQCGIELQGLIENEVQHFLHRLQEYLDLNQLAFSLRAQRVGLDDNLLLRAKRENAIAILLSLTSIALTAGNWLHSDQNFSDLYSYIKNLDRQVDLDSLRATMITGNVRLLKNVTELVAIRQNLIFQSLTQMAYKHSCDLKAQFQRKGLQTLHNNLQAIFTDIVGGRLTNRYFGLTALRELVINTTIFRQSKNCVRPSVLYELASAALLSINHEEQSMRFVTSYP